MKREPLGAGPLGPRGPVWSSPCTWSAPLRGEPTGQWRGSAWGAAGDLGTSCLLSLVASVHALRRVLSEADALGGAGQAGWPLGWRLARGLGTRCSHPLCPCGPSKRPLLLSASAASPGACSPACCAFSAAFVSVKALTRSLQWAWTSTLDFSVKALTSLLFALYSASGSAWHRTSPR